MAHPAPPSVCPPAPPRASGVQCGARGRDPCDRHTKWRAAHVVEPELLEDGDARRVSPMLAAYPHLQVGLGAAPTLDRDPHQPADANRVDGLERAERNDATLDVARQEATLGVVAREPERGLGEVVGAEAEEVGVPGDRAGAQACPPAARSSCRSGGKRRRAPRRSSAPRRRAAAPARRRRRSAAASPQRRAAGPGRPLRAPPRRSARACIS